MLWRRSAGLLVLVLVALGCPVRAFSADRFMIKPKVSGECRVDSNYYKTESDEREVYTYILRPGVELGYMSAKSLVALDYTADFYFYDETGDSDENVSDENPDGFLGHTLSFKSRTRPLDRLTVGLDDSFYETRDPSQTDVVSDRVTRETYWINRFSPYVFYDFAPRFGAGARYRRTDLNYRTGDEEDSVEHRGIFDLIYHFSRTGSLDLEYQHWKMIYDTTSDYESDQINLILRKQFNRLSFEAGGGYHERRFQDASYDNIETFTYHGGVTWEQGRSQASLFTERNFNNYHQSGDYYVATRYTLSLSHVFLEKLPASIRGIYQNSNYDNVVSDEINNGREDNGYLIAGSLGYIFTNWLSVTGEVGYEERDSNIDGYDYENEYVLFRLDLAYDIGSRNH